MPARAHTRPNDGWQLYVTVVVWINFVWDRRIALEKCWRKPRRYRQPHFAGRANLLETSQHWVGVGTCATAFGVYHTFHLTVFAFQDVCAGRWHRIPRTAANELKLYHFHSRRSSSGTHDTRQFPFFLCVLEPNAQTKEPSGSHYCSTEHCFGIPSQPIYYANFRFQKAHAPTHCGEMRGKKIAKFRVCRRNGNDISPEKID